MILEHGRGLVESYLKWLKDRTALREVGDWLEVTTPFLDRHNDYIQIFVQKNGEAYQLTDDGYTIEDLEQSGCKLNTSKRQGILETTLNGFGVKLEDGCLTVQATESDFPARKHLLIQAILAVDDMFYLAEPHVAALFREDLAGWLEDHDIRYTESIKLSGASGYDHVFDFVISGSREIPDRLVRAFNTPSRKVVESMAFSSVDTREARPRKSDLFAFLNDQNSPVPQTVADGLREYEIEPVPWSKRDAVLDRLAA